MKIRMGFITNSSSTNFLIISKKELTEDYLFKKLGFIKGGALEEQGRQLCNSIMNAIEGGLRYYSCEAATFSMYIDSRMNCYPCSFGIWNKEISESMKDKTLREIWRGKTFSAFREKSKEKCFNCKQKSLCQNGCRLGMNIELC